MRITKFAQTRPCALSLARSECASLSLYLQLRLDLAAGLDALQYALAVLVDLQLGNDHLGWVDTEGDGLARGLLLHDTLDVDDILETIDRGDLAFAALVGPSNDGDFIILSDGDRADLEIAYVVLLTELLAERGTHDRAPDAGRRIVMGLARLSSRRVKGCECQL
ncbi:unnamed protein product [Diplocarpon coronariae]